MISTDMLKQVIRPFGLVVALLLMLLIMSDAYAGDVPLSRVHTLDADFDATNSVATAGMKGDGLDILGAAQNSNAISWWTNNGDGEHWSEQIPNRAFAGARRVTVADMDQRSLNNGIIYVDDSASGANNGTSWADAYTDLQNALAAATTGDQIWVAAGSYKPTSGADRSATFQLKNGVAMYGGFDGTETSREQRDWEVNPAILSGDLNGNDNNNVAHDEPTRADNSYHVVISYGTDSGTVLDGFIITSGNASDNGGGMYNFSNSRVTVRHVIFRNNSALADGAGMVNYDSQPTLNDVTFTDNSASSSGGGMTNGNSRPTLTDVDFTGNSVAPAKWTTTKNSTIMLNRVPISTK